MSTTLTAPRFSRPAPATGRAIVLSGKTGSGDYFDGAAFARDSDFGAWSTPRALDHLFTSAIRALTIARIRREAINNAYLSGLVLKYPEAVGHTALRSRTSVKAYNLRKERWWFRSTRRLTINGWSLRRVERVGAIELLCAGEYFLVKLASGHVQLVASEYCGSPTGLADDSAEVNGIVHDPATRTPVAYRFGRMTRWGTVQFSGGPEELVPAAAVIHVFDPFQVLQGRGLPWLLASLKPARDLYEITRSKTKQIKDVTALSGFIEKQAAAEFLRGLGVSETASTDTPVETADSAADRVPAKDNVIELGPGMFIALEPGEKVNALMSEYKATDYKELVMLMLHAISSPVGLPVELWFSGLGDVNYSGFKGLGVQWQSRRKYVQEFLEESALDPLVEWAARRAEITGDLPQHPDPERDYEQVQWGWKRAAVLDDERSAKSNQLRLQTGESSHADIWEQDGRFADEVLEERRQLWIQLLIAAGEIDGTDEKAVAAVKVPRGFLLRNELPGTTTYRYMPDGSGGNEGGAAADQSGRKTSAAPAAAPVTPDNEDSETEDDENESETEQ